MLDPSIVSEASNTRGASTNKRTRRAAAGIEKRLRLDPDVQGYLTPEEAEPLVPRGYVITSDLEVVTEAELRGRVAAQTAANTTDGRHTSLKGQEHIS